VLPALAAAQSTAERPSHEPENDPPLVRPQATSLLTRPEVIAGVSFVPEIYDDATGNYYPICGHHFWDTSNGANLVCQELGFDNGSVEATRDAYNVDAMPVGYCAEHDDTLQRCTGGGNAYGDLSLNDGVCTRGNPIGVRVVCELETDPAETRSEPENEPWSSDPAETRSEPENDPTYDPAELEPWSSALVKCSRCHVEPAGCGEALRMVLSGGCASDCDFDLLEPYLSALQCKGFEFDDIVSASRLDSCFDHCLSGYEAVNVMSSCLDLMTHVRPPACASRCSHDAILSPYQALGCDFDIATARGLRFDFNEELIVRAADAVIVAPGVPFVPEVARASTSSGIGEFTEICGHWFWNNHNGAMAVCNALGYPSGSLLERGNVLGTDALFIGECNPGEALEDCSANQNRYDYSCEAGSRAGIVVICSDEVPEPVPPECLRCEVEPANCGEALRTVLPGGCASDCDFDALEPYLEYFEEVHGVECRFAFEGIMHGLALGPVEHPADDKIEDAGEDGTARNLRKSPKSLLRGDAK